MATPTPQIDQPSPGVGTPGVSRDDLVLGELATVSDPANGAGSYVYTMLAVPEGSAVPLGVFSTNPTGTFTPDVTGSYLIEEVFNGTESARIVGAVRTAGKNIRIPAPGETTEFGATGWHPARDEMLRIWDGESGSGDENVKVSANDTTASTLDNKLVAGANITLTENNDGGNETLTIASTASGADENVGVSANDTTPGKLTDKLVAGSNITLTENNDGGNETLTIDAAGGGGTDENVAVSANDTTPGNLLAKLTAGTNITLTEQNDGGNETLQIAATGGASDENVAVSANDTTPGNLTAKLVAGANITLTENNDGGNETLTIASSGAGASGPVTAAEGSYLRAGLSADQVNPALNDAVAWDVEHVAAGDGITLNTSNGQITVKAGRQVRLTAQLQLIHTAAFLQQYGWYDVTNAAELPGTRQTNRSTTASANFSSTQISSTIVRPSVDTIYELRLLDNTTANVDIDGGTDEGGATWVECFEIGAVQADVVGGLEFLDQITVDVATDTVTFGASGDGDFQRALDGETDGEYILVSRIIKDGTLRRYDIRLNGATTDQETRALGVFTSVTTTFFSESVLLNTSFDEAHI